MSSFKNQKLLDKTCRTRNEKATETSYGVGNGLAGDWRTTAQRRGKPGADIAGCLLADESGQELWHGCFLTPLSPVVLKLYLQTGRSCLQTCTFSLKGIPDLPFCLSSSGILSMIMEGGFLQVSAG